MTKPFEELRQAYKELLADNQQLTADNRKLRKEVTELKMLNDGYVKIIAKNQETNNKLMASVDSLRETYGEVYERWVKTTNERKESAEAYKEWLGEDMSEKMPNISAERVVRCKDCRHRVHDEERGLYYCEMYYGQGDVSDENFCQWGERREE